MIRSFADDETEHLFITGKRGCGSSMLRPA
jgi:hypothetical protein